MRTSFAIAVTVGRSGLSLAQPASAQADDSKARQGAFRDIVQAGSAEAFRPRDAVPAFVLVSRIAKGLRGCAQGRSRMRHRLLGHRAEPAVESRTFRRPRRISPRAPPRSPRERASAPRRQRERDYIDALAVMYADHDKVDHCTRVAGLCQGDGAARAALSERRRGADPLRARAQHVGFARRQDLRQPAQGRGDPGADLQAPAAASRRRALSDPPLRLSADRREGARMPRGSTPRSRPARRTRSTCRRTSSRASAIGRSRSTPTRSRSASPRRPPISTTSCTRWTTRSMPICSSARTRRPRPSSTR